MKLKYFFPGLLMLFAACSNDNNPIKPQTVYLYQKMGLVDSLFHLPPSGGAFKSDTLGFIDYTTTNHIQIKCTISAEGIAFLYARLTALKDTGNATMFAINAVNGTMNIDTVVNSPKEKVPTVLSLALQLAFTWISVHDLQIIKKD
jgi:hypothetical protein